jgi:murein DD-endopeptidase MepM/ murein hydrolase activator NlpD
MRLVSSISSKYGASALGLALCVTVALCVVPGCARGKKLDAQPFPKPGAAPPSSVPSIWPVDRGRCQVSSRYGLRVHPKTGAQKMHWGVDLRVAEGTPVWAAADGEVTFSGVQSGYGNLLVLRHGERLETAYGHLKKRLVQVGERVRRGKCIGQAGRTGNATGAHLHYEVRAGGKKVDPEPYLP